MNLVELLLGPAATTPDAPALRAGAVDVTYRALADRAARDAARLMEAGAKPGDRVAICVPNGVGFVTAYLATLHAGAVAVPLNPSAPEPELVRQMEQVGASVTALGPDVRLPGALPAVVFGDSGFEGAAAGVLDSGDAGRRRAGRVAVHLGDGRDAPKAAVLTHGNLAANIPRCSTIPGLAIRADDVVPRSRSPFHHIFGLNVVLRRHPSPRASAVVLEDHFDPVATLELIDAATG